MFPAIWLLPKDSKYGQWPRSGEIDVVETRGNLNYTDENGVFKNTKLSLSSLHCGPDSASDGVSTTQWSK